MVESDRKRTAGGCFVDSIAAADGGSKCVVEVWYRVEAKEGDRPPVRPYAADVYGWVRGSELDVTGLQFPAAHRRDVLPYVVERFAATMGA